MTDVYTTVVGFVGTDVDYRKGNGTNQRASFRLASTPRFFDSAQGAWRDLETVWVSVKAWRSLASNVSLSLHKGEPVVVHGRLRTYVWRDEHDQERSRLELEAISVGHDLCRGASAFTRPPSAGEPDQQRRNRADDPSALQPRNPGTEWPQQAVIGDRASAHAGVVTS